MVVRMLLIGISFFEIWLLYQLLCGIVLEKEHFQKKEWVILGGNIVGLGVILGINRSLLFYSQYMFVICIAVTCICVVFIERENKRFTSIIVILYYTAAALLDFFFAFISMMVLKQEFDKRIYIYANSWMECVLFICSRMIIAGCVNIVVKKKYEKTDLYEFQRILTVITVAMCLMLRYYQTMIVAMIYENREMEAGVVGISLASALLIIFLTGLLYLKSRMFKKEKEFLAMREEMMAQRFMELENAMERNRQLSHDLRNHFIVLKNFEKEGNYEGIHHYIEEVEHEFFEVKVRTWTGNPIADMLIEQKRALAEREGVTFDIQVVPIKRWPFSDSETCSLLGNLLDNAIDACTRIKSGDRWIAIRIESQKQLLFIKIENSIDEVPVMKNGIPISAKFDKKGHGYGLKSVGRIVNMHDGIITYQVRENVFQAYLSF